MLRAIMRSASVLLALLLASQSASAQTTYPLSKSDHPEIGSNIKPSNVWSKFPFNKRYGELSEEEREIIRAQYTKLNADDEPPYPKDGMAAIAKEVGKLQQRVLMEGPLIMTVRVDDQGRAQSASIYQTPSPDLAKAVVYVLMKEDYKPAKCAGIPCTMEFLFHFNFSVRQQ